MLKDLSERDFDEKLLAIICENIYEELGTIPENLDRHNSIRLLTSLIKSGSYQQFDKVVYPKIILKFLNTLFEKLQNEI
jgi:hypothetical protein